MRTPRLISSLLFCIATQIAAHAQTTTPTCTAATLTGVRSLVLTGRDVGAGIALVKTYQAVGSASFDGVSQVAFSLTVNTNTSQGASETYTGTYSLASNCVGSVTITTGDTATYTLIAYNSGKNYTLTGQDGVYAFTGSGGPPPAACITASLSGIYAFSGNGFTLTSGAVSGVNDISGLLQFDGRGGIKANWAVASNGSSTSDTASGEYTLTPSCQGAATLTDASSVAYTLNLTATSNEPANFGVDIANSQAVFSGSGHSTFTAPPLTIVNGGSYAESGTPPGSDFVLFGTNITSGSSAQANVVPLPKTLLTTSLTVNGESTPLYFVNATQLNAQMPLDIQPGLAAVTLTTNGMMSNSAAVLVPATAAPGIFFYGSDRGVFQNPNFSLNSPTAPAQPGDVEVAYFTGGGPVTPAGTLTTGAASPLGLSPVKENTSITVGGMAATINYIGLAPTLVGVYQANFVIPQVAAGNRTVVIGIGGTNSLGALITIAQ